YLFFSPVSPPPTSPLCPYTTLFRSELLRTGKSALRSGGSKEMRPPGPRTVQRFGVSHSRVPLVVNRSAARFQEAANPPRSCKSRDRKSTRLNSSHGSISYAVFCLKK